MSEQRKGKAPKTTGTKNPSKTVNPPRIPTNSMRPLFVMIIYGSL